MSQAPRPCSSPATTRPENGSGVDQAAGSPTGTTSTWPLSISGRAVARAGAGQAADQAPGLVPVHLDAGEVGRGEQLGQRQPPVVDLQAGGGQLDGQQRLDLVLGVGAAHARHGDQLGQPLLRGRRARVDLLQDAGSPVGHAREPRGAAMARPLRRGTAPRGLVWQA